MAENKFYVYAYLDPRKEGKFVYGEYEFSHEPFYIGKGTGKRISFSNHDHNLHLVRKIKSIRREDKKPITVKVVDNVSEEFALDLEIRLIKDIGRNYNGGPLTNHTDGGEGTSGRACTEEEKAIKSKMYTGKGNPFYGKKLSKDAETRRMASFRKTMSDPSFIHGNTGKERSKQNRKNISETLKRNSLRSDYVNPMSGVKHSEESKKSMSDTLLKNHADPNYIDPKIGKHLSTETKNKIARTLKGKYAGEKASFWGKKHTAETRLKISESKIKNRELKIQELYQSIINLIIRKEEILCGV